MLTTSIDASDPNNSSRIDGVYTGEGSTPRHAWSCGCFDRWWFTGIVGAGLGEVWVGGPTLGLLEAVAAR